MKSLEILDKNTDWYGDVILKASEVETIKQDLEALEIIRKKKVDVYYLHALLKNGEVDVVLNRYNIYAREGALTMEELIKLKQWLEENDNELGK